MADDVIRVAAVLLAGALAASPAAADWDAQVSSRVGLGGGVYVLEQGADPWPMLELALRTDLLLGEARPSTVRFGPALDVRTEGFRTLEVGGALAALFPTGQGFGLTATGGAGWGARPEGRDGAFAFGQLAFGYRPYNYFSAYAYGIDVYGACRVQLENGRAWEITVGVEVDVEFLFAIPVMFLVELARARDPHEPMEPDAEE